MTNPNTKCDCCGKTFAQHSVEAPNPMPKMPCVGWQRFFMHPPGQEHTEDFLCNTEDGACRFSVAMQEMQTEVERLRAQLEETSKAARVEAGVWNVDAQAWKKRALELRKGCSWVRHLLASAEAEVERLQAKIAEDALTIGAQKDTIAQLRQQLEAVAYAGGGTGGPASDAEVERLQAKIAEDALTIGSLRAALAGAHVDKDSAYRERNRLVSALSKIFPSHLMQHEDDPLWDADWRTIVCIELPTGQATWHVHDSDKPLFQHLAECRNDWDGHSTEEKYRRLATIGVRWKWAGGLKLLQWFEAREPWVEEAMEGGRGELIRWMQDNPKPESGK